MNTSVANSVQPVERRDVVRAVATSEAPDWTLARDAEGLALIEAAAEGREG